MLRPVEGRCHNGLMVITLIALGLAASELRHGQGEMGLAGFSG